MTETTINQRIKILINALNISSRAFSAALDAPDATTRNYVDGRSKPGADYLEKILRRFERVSPDWLLTGAGGMFRSELGESSTTSQNNSGGNSVGINAGSGKVSQKNTAVQGQPPDNTILLSRQEYSLLQSQIKTLQNQLADKERIIQLLEMQIKKG